jgi:hypothetical protein
MRKTLLSFIQPAEREIIGMSGKNLIRLIGTLIIDDQDLPIRAVRDSKAVHRFQRLIEQRRTIPRANTNTD